MPPLRSWTDVQSIVIDGQLALTRLVRAGRQSAIFEANTGADSVASYFVQLYRVADEQEGATLVQRLDEARYFSHPGLMKVAGAGYNQPENVVYSVTGAPDKVLALLSPGGGHLSLEEVTALTRQVVAALSYLHSENMVFCNLRTEAVWQAGGEWKLADFSQLRLIGRSDTKELRLALARYGDVPPEAYQGVVSPAWDIWSLGVLLQRVLVEDSPASGPRARQLRAGLPEPFQTVVRECLEPDPAARISLDGIVRILASPAPPIASTMPADYSVPAFAAAARDGDADGPSGWRRAFDVVRAPRLSWLLILIVGILGVGVWTWALSRRTPAREVVIAPLATEADRTNPRAAAPSPIEVQPQPEPGNVSDPGEAGVQALLSQWVTSTRARDLPAHTACYAPVVDVFYGQRHLSHNQLYAEKQREFNSIGVVKSFDIGNVQITRLDRNSAGILFTKRWAFGENGGYSGSVRSQLTVHRIQGAWKIVSERELRVYFVTRAGAAAGRRG